MKEADTKREQIILVALRRFSHFGIQKTTMSEIADDLQMSKPALYYYFPDKSSIVIEAAGKIIDEYLLRARHTLSKHSNIEEAVLALIDLRYEFVKKYYMLHINESDTEQSLRDEKFILILRNMRNEENEMLSTLLEKKMDDGVLNKINPLKVATLLLDTLLGLSFSLHISKKPIPDDKTFDEIFQKQKEVALIFINGIKFN